MAIWTIDQSGELVGGFFYELRVALTRRRKGNEPDDWIFSSSADEERFVWSDGASWTSVKKRFECPVNKEHKTGSEPVGVDVCLCGGDIVGSFIPDMSVAFVNEALAATMASSGLVGVKTIAAKVVVNQGGADDPKIHHLHLGGRDPCRKPRIEPATANKCPFCGFAPLYCPSCGVGSAVCPRCEERCIITRKQHTGDDDPRIVCDDSPGIDHIVEAKRWDGNDFCGGWLRGVITRRALDLLLSVHAAPFTAVPLRTDVSGLTKEEWDRLEQAKIPPKSK